MPANRVTDANTRFPPMSSTLPPFVLGIAGGSGSGKTTITHEVVQRLGGDVDVLQHDSYYRHRPELPFEERAELNYDHPDSLETDLMVEHLEALLAGRPAEIPEYDFNQHLRRPETRTLHSAPVIVVEGILVLSEPSLRKHMDLTVFVDTDADLRLSRRLQRDVTERGRTTESVLAQWEKSVRPMYLAFVDPSKRHADLIIQEGYSEEAVSALESVLIQRILQRQSPTIAP